MTSCYDYDDDKLAEAQLQIVSLTNYDTKVNFSNYKTFAIADSIVIITEDSNGDIAPTPTANGQQLIDEVANILSANYTKVDTSESPDLAVTLYAFKVDNVSYDWWYDYDWWYWYWDWYPYDWYYPYYPYTYTTSYSVGTLLINIVDLKAKDKDSGRYPIVWTGIVRNVLSDTHTLSEIQSAIRDCFNQGTAFTNNK